MNVQETQKKLLEIKSMVAEIFFFESTDYLKNKVEETTIKNGK